MKYISLVVVILCTTLSLFAQQHIAKTAIIKMKSEMTFPQRGDGGGPGGGGGGGDRMMVMGGPGGAEMATTAWYREDFLKMETKSDMGNNITIYDKKSQRTTTLTESMGKKSGFYSTPEDRQEMQTRMDSIRKARRDSIEKAGGNVQERDNRPSSISEVVLTEESRKIAGYNCKKAIIRTAQANGNTSEVTVWYTPDFNLPAGWNSTGPTQGGGPGGGGFGGMMMPNSRDLAKIPGFPMAYAMERANGFKMNMEVTKVELDKPLEDKNFEVPKGYEVKSIKEMQNRGGQQGQVFIRAN